MWVPDASWRGIASHDRPRSRSVLRPQIRLPSRYRLALVAAAVEDGAQIAAVNVLEGDVVRLLDHAEVEDLGDVRVVQLNRDLRLVDEHLDELFVLRDVRQDALDGNQALEALYAVGFGTKYLGHPPDVDPLEQEVLAEWNRLLHGNRLVVVIGLEMGFSGESGSDSVTAGQPDPGM
jgi:hypothetical protein